MHKKVDFKSGRTGFRLERGDFNSVNIDLGLSRRLASGLKEPELGLRGLRGIYRHMNI